MKNTFLLLVTLLVGPVSMAQDHLPELNESCSTIVSVGSCAASDSKFSLELILESDDGGMCWAVQSGERFTVTLEKTTMSECEHLRARAQDAVRSSGL